MSRRKQTTPNKVHWEHVFAGLEEQTRQAMMKRDFQGLLGAQPASTTHQEQPQEDSSSSDSEGDEDTTQEETSSPASEEDAAPATVKKEQETTELLGRSNQLGFGSGQDALLGLSRCPLCQVECGSREQLITHVYQPS